MFKRVVHMVADTCELIKFDMKRTIQAKCPASRTAMAKKRFLPEKGNINVKNRLRVEKDC